jgi:hypothetical protein
MNEQGSRSQQHPIPSSFVTSIQSHGCVGNDRDKEDKLTTSQTTTRPITWIPAPWHIPELLTLAERFLYLEMRKRRSSKRMTLDDFYIVARKVYQHYSSSGDSTSSTIGLPKQADPPVIPTDLSKEEELLYQFVCATTPTLHVLRQYSEKELFFVSSQTSDADVQKIWCLEQAILEKGSSSNRPRILAQLLERKKVEKETSDRILACIHQNRNQSNSNETNQDDDENTHPQTRTSRRMTTRKTLQEIARPLEALIRPGMTIEQRVLSRQTALSLASTTTPKTFESTSTSHSDPAQQHGAVHHALDPSGENLVRLADALWSHASRCQSSSRKNLPSIQNGNDHRSHPRAIKSKPFTTSLKDLVLKLRISTATAQGVPMSKRQIVNQIHTLAIHFPEFISIVGNLQDPETLVKITVLSIHYQSIRARLTTSLDSSQPLPLHEPKQQIQQNNWNSLLHPLQQQQIKTPISGNKRKHFWTEVTSNKNLRVKVRSNK